MRKTHHNNLTRRERQTLDILYRRGSAHAREVMEELPGKPNYSAVRAQLRVLEEKGLVRHEEKGLRYVYFPTVPRNKARQSMLRHVVDTFFDGSVGQVMAALLGGGLGSPSDKELDYIEKLIEDARKGERP
jgi:predicted transcriptional regulator